MRLHTTVTLLAASARLTLAAPSFLSLRSPDAAQSCGEKADRVCFGVEGGTSQGINVDDLQYVADFLRYLTSDDPAALWTMPGGGFDCDEWTLPIEGAGTVLALAKHINPRINSSVLYTDIAATIDGGGENASDQAKKESLLGACGTHGGMVAVKVNASDPAYQSAEYKKVMAKPEGIIIKIVKAPS